MGFRVAQLARNVAGILAALACTASAPSGVNSLQGAPLFDITSTGGSAGAGGVESVQVSGLVADDGVLDALDAFFMDMSDDTGDVLVLQPGTTGLNHIKIGAASTTRLRLTAEEHAWLQADATRAIDLQREMD